jgi:hypothetical protein
MKKVFFYIILAAILTTSCTATKRLERLLTRNPHLTAIDTVVIHHETILPKIEYRNRFITEPNDTITIFQDKTEFKIIRQLDSIFVEIDRPPDTIRETIKIPVEVIRYETPNAWHMLAKRIPWIVVLVFLILGAIYWKKS